MARRWLGISPVAGRAGQEGHIGRTRPIARSGLPLFDQDVTPAVLKLVDVTATSTGDTVHTFRPAGRPSYASFVDT